MIVHHATKIGSPGFRRWVLDRVPDTNIQRLKEIVDIVSENTSRIFFDKRAALEAGDAAVEEQLASGRDIMSILRE